jgi:hypothetical protein
MRAKRLDPKPEPPLLGYSVVPNPKRLKDPRGVLEYIKGQDRKAFPEINWFQ